MGLIFRQFWLSMYSIDTMSASAHRAAILAGMVTVLHLSWTFDNFRGWNFIQILREVFLFSQNTLHISVYVTGNGENRPV